MNTESIRERLSRGETGEALRALVALLEPDKRYRKNLLRIARLNQAEYQAVREKELKGILSFTEAQREYSRINDNLLDLLDDLDEGRLPAGVPLPGPRRYLPWAAGGLAALTITAGAWQYTARQAESGAWQQAAEQATRAAYLHYREKYPDHAHTLAAADSLAALDKKVQHWLQSARALILAEEPAEARKTLENVRRADPQNPELIRLTEQLK